MANYDKTVDFAAKDDLPPGDINKRIKGEDIDDQFNAIATAISSKSDSNTVPTLTGNNTLSGTNTFSGAIVKSASTSDQAYFGATPTSYSSGGTTATGVLSGVTTVSTKVGVVAQSKSGGAGIAADVAHDTSGGALIHFGYVGGGSYGDAGTIALSGTTGVIYGTSSDYRLKENVATLTGAVDRVKQLNPVRFTWIANPAFGAVDGFLAHEVSAVVPEAVLGQKDDTHADGSIKAQGIDQSKLVPLLVAAVKELTARVEALENN